MYRSRKAALVLSLALPTGSFAGVTYLSGTANYRHTIENGGTTFNSSDSSIPVESNLPSVGYTLNSNQVFGGDGATSLGKARIGYISNATTASIALKTGTGISQSDPGAAPSHAFSETRIEFRDATALRWDVTAPGFGPPSSRYANINVAGTVGAGGFARCFVNLAFYKNSISGANSLGSIVLDTGTITTAGAFNQNLVYSQPLSNTTLPTGTDILMIGTITFTADNHLAPTDIELLDSSIGYSNSGTFSAYVGPSNGQWLNSNNWQGDEGSPSQPPDAIGTRAYFPNDTGTPRNINLANPVTVGVLENNGSARTTITSATSMPLNLNNVPGFPSQVWNRGVAGNAALDLAVPLNINAGGECVFTNDSAGQLRVMNGWTTFGNNPVIRKDGPGPMVISGNLNTGVAFASYFFDEGTTTLNSDLGGAVNSPQSFTGGVHVGFASEAATLVMTSPQRLNELHVADRGLARFDHAGRVASAVRTLTMNTASTARTQVDITDDGLVFRPLAGDPFSSVMNLVTSGHNVTGDWNGDGIISSVAAVTPGTGIAYSRVSELGNNPSTFMGQAVDANDVVVRYTLLGDADANGSVTLNDFARLAANFNTTGAWPRGDFNYDLTINIGDFSLLASNFNRSLPPPRVPIPEPAGLLLSPLMMMLARRGRFGGRAKT